MSVNTKDIRNVAIIGHNGTGKTNLIEQMLFYAGVLSRAETVESGKTVSDYTDEEIQRKMSVHSTLASMQWDGKQINVIDTPGTGDFIGEAISSFRATEAALMVVDGREGAQIETIKLWRRLDERNKPRAVFINKMDKERASFRHTIDSLVEEFGSHFVPVVMALGEAEEFHGVINLIENQAYEYHEGGKETPMPIPEKYAAVVEDFRNRLIENAAEGTDELIEKYFAEGTLEPDDIRHGLAVGMRTNRVVPVFCGATDKGAGITSLLNFIKNNFPWPLGIQEYIIGHEGEETTIEIDPEKAFSAYCFKTTIDQFSGKMSFLKVVTGVLTPETDIYNNEIGKKAKPGKLYRAVGKKLVETDSLAAGDIGIITKCDIAYTNATFVAGPEYKRRFRPLKMPQPVYQLAISADDKKSEDKMNEALHRIAEEDLTFQVTFNEETKESIIGGMGELHIGMILDKVQEKQKVKINTRTPRIAYRETITKDSGLSEYTHKKQTGGHGQFGRVVIDIKPTERGEYYSFENVIKGGAVSKGYIPGIEKGIHEAMEEGYLAGYPLVDIAVTLIDGKEHPVDSSEMAFKLAAKGAMQVALGKAGCVLLEPFVKLEVFIEDEYLGAILSDLSSKRGRVLGQEEKGHVVSVRAEVPMAELRNYAIELKSMTSGTGSFEIEFDHYEELHGKLADDVIAEAKKAKEEAQN
ncbi:MAG: elongation factor G [Spirochaetes bacterium]|uniref:Elongation factor G n=1 Tax=Candidatus Ornithospirochaeta stercoripullorum TaxID=2840899 RepID=A0A9D9DZC3_9SPIO|nr:elongation factor G [Candidatus Ornithospirochaeta stercoripullorum]